MKKLHILASLLLSAMVFTACSTDRDDNPTLDLTKQQAPIVLNTPAFASGTYDMNNTAYLQLNCTQPDYGFPATVTYAVQMSIDEDMSTPTELSTTYSLNSMEVKGRDLAIAITKQLMTKRNKQQTDFPMQIPVYLRIRAFIEGLEGTEALSNIVKLDNVKTQFALPDVEVPNPFYVCGSFTGNDWEKAVPSAPVNGVLSSQWRMVWVDQDGVKVSPTKGEANYANDMISVSYKCSTDGFSVTDEGLVTATTPGWYIMLIEGAADNEKRQMELTFSFYEGEVWLIGTSIVNPDAGITSDNCWSEKELRENYTKYVKFEVPTTKDGEFVSPELTSPVDGDGGSRCYVKIKSYEWWKSEFFVFSEKIVYRGAGGDQERINGNVGQRVYLNFSNDTGALK